MQWISRNVTLLRILVLSGLVCFVGCSPPTAERSGPSYSEVLTVYNQEVETLDRLERKRDELVAKHEAAIAPAAEDASQSLDALLSSAREAAEQLDIEGVTDSNDLLDRAVEHAERAQEVTSELLESVSSATEPTEEELQAQAELTAQFESELAAIDAQIAEQKARVERARNARDAAEAARN